MVPNREVLGDIYFLLRTVRQTGGLPADSTQESNRTAVVPLSIISVDTTLSASSTDSDQWQRSSHQSPRSLYTLTHSHPSTWAPFSCLEHPSHGMNVRFLLGALDQSDFCLGAFSPGPELLSHKKSPNISVPCLMPLVYISYYFRHRAQRSIFDKRQGCGC